MLPSPPARAMSTRYWSAPAGKSIPAAARPATIRLTMAESTDAQRSALPSSYDRSWLPNDAGSPMAASRPAESTPVDATPPGCRRSARYQRGASYGTEPASQASAGSALGVRPEQREVHERPAHRRHRGVRRLRREEPIPDAERDDVGREPVVDRLDGRDLDVADEEAAGLEARAQGRQPSRGEPADHEWEREAAIRVPGGGDDAAVGVDAERRGHPAHGHVRVREDPGHQDVVRRDGRRRRRPGRRGGDRRRRRVRRGRQVGQRWRARERGGRLRRAGPVARTSRRTRRTRRDARGEEDPEEEARCSMARVHPLPPVLRV
jgi:hypothetical protein